ncbi:MAG: ABC transporter permease [Candidatus Izemoplasmataceae bacterium]
MIRFYALRVLNDKIGHIILIGLPLALMTIMIALNREQVDPSEMDAMILYIGLIYIIMFQGFGSAYTFEGLEYDFYKPFKARLLVSPVNPIKFVFSNLIANILVSYLQSLVLILYLIVFYAISIPNLIGLLFVLLLGVIFSQLLASLIIFLVNKASIAQAIITVYIIIAMMIGGFFVSFSRSNLVIFLEKFSSPLAWVRYTAYGFIDGELDVIFKGLSLLIGSILILLLLTYKLSQKVLR